MRLAILACCFVLAGSPGFGQAAPEFEVASVKPAAPPAGRGGLMNILRGGPGTSDPGRIAYSNWTLKSLVMRAYSLRPDQFDGPDWLNSVKFDITATIPEGATSDDVKRMLQGLLAERFHLTVHHESRELPIYELTVAKSGPKMKPSVADPNAPAPPPGPPPRGKDGFPQLAPGRPNLVVVGRRGGLHLAASVQTTATLARFLGSELGGSLVENQTGLDGTYDFVLDFSRDTGRAAALSASTPDPPGGPLAGPAAQADDVPNIFAAVQEQLGLRLEKKKSAVDVVVVDHSDRTPTEN
jgi:uncharacterized protein (TIGR03435 family)